MWKVVVQSLKFNTKPLAVALSCLCFLQVLHDPVSYPDTKKGASDIISMIGTMHVELRDMPLELRKRVEAALSSDSDRCVLQATNTTSNAEGAHDLALKQTMTAPEETPAASPLKRAGSATSQSSLMGPPPSPAAKAKKHKGQGDTMVVMIS